MNQLGNVRTAQAVHSRAAIRLRRWQRVFRSALVLGLLSFAPTAFAAIPITEGLNGPFTLDSAPAVTEWSTASIAGGGGDITTVEQLTTAVQAFTAASISTALPVVADAIPPINGLARFASTSGTSPGGIVMAPTGNRATLLMATLQNAHTNYITDMSVSFDMSQLTANEGETVLGWSAYYSGTGAANSWVPIGVQGEFSPASYFINDLGTSFGGNPFYLLFADDNGGGNDLRFLLDNLVIETAVGPDPWEPPPPPTPQFGDQLPPAAYDVTGGDLGIADRTGGEVQNLADGPGGALNDTLHVRGSMTLVTEQVDLRTTVAPVEVSFDLKTMDTSDGSDFELNEDSVDAFIEWSIDGLTFQSLQFVELDGGTPPVAPEVWPVPDDELKPLDGGELGPYTNFSAFVPAEAETFRLKIVAVNTSGTEHFYVDNLNVAIVPEPATVAMFGLGMIGLVGYARRRRSN